MLTGAADEFLRIFERLALGLHIRGVIALGANIVAAHLHRVQFVAPDAAVEDFLRARSRIETPGAMLAHQRDRKRPFLRADDERRPVRAIKQKFVSRRVAFREAGPHARILDPVAGIHQLLSGGTEDGDKRRGVIAVCGVGQRTRHGLGAREGLRFDGRRHRAEHSARTPTAKNACFTMAGSDLFMTLASL